MHGQFENKTNLHYIRVIAVYCESQAECVNKLVIKCRVLSAKRGCAYVVTTKL